MDDRTRTLWINRIIAELGSLPAGQWERFAHVMSELYAGRELLHRGQTARGNPRGYTLDTYSDDGAVAGEYGSDPDYFRDLKKPMDDFAHVQDQLPNAKQVFLLGSPVASATEATAIAKWVGEVASNKIALVVQDARSIAEYLVDHVRSDDRASARVAAHLETMRVLSSEYAASHLVPVLAPQSVVREALVQELLEELAQHRVVVLSGMSGIGKSELAAMIGRRLGPEVGATVWVTGRVYRSSSELGSIEVERRDWRVNLLGMIAGRSCLVVLDDVQVEGPLHEFVEQIRGACGPEARVLLTSQVSMGGRRGDVAVPMLSAAESRRLLESESDQCPEEVWHEIWRAVGGHPLALRLLGSQVGMGAPWTEVAQDARQAGNLPVFERASHLAGTLLERWRSTVEAPLQVFAWCGVQQVHSEVLRYAVGRRFAEQLARLGLVASAVPGLTRLHDVVWSSIPAFLQDRPGREREWEAKLDQYVEANAAHDAGSLELNHLARTHFALVHRLATSGPCLPGHLYLWLLGADAETVTLQQLPDALQYAEAAADAAASDFKCQVAVELAEKHVLLSDQRAKTDNDSGGQSALLRPFDLLLESDGVSESAKGHVRHHRAKALKRMRRYTEARHELEALVPETEEGCAPAASRLLLARLLTEAPKDLMRDGDGTRAQRLLLGLLDEGRNAPDTTSASITLAAVELLRRNAVGLDLQEVIPRYAEVLESFIARALERGLEQGALALAAIGNAWREVDSETFLRLVGLVPLPAPTDLKDPEECEAWGEVCEAAAECDPGRRDVFLREALSFHMASPKPYGRTHAAHVLIKLGSPLDALSVLEPLLVTARSSARVWPLIRQSEALEALGDHVSALRASGEAKELMRPDNRHFPTVEARVARLQQVVMSKAE